MHLNTYHDKRVFITGHTGFKGSWLALWLSLLGAKVTGYALPPAYSRSHFELLGLENKIEHIEGDIRDYSALKGALESAAPDFVFHLAAQALVRPAYASPKETFDTNVGGSVNLLEALRKTAYEGTLVYITSDKCYRNQEWEWGYRENDMLGGKDPYSASKGAAELVFNSYQHSYFLQSPIKAASTRAGNVIGGGDWAEDRLIPDCMRALMKNQTITLRNPTATRPWQHVLEPLNAYLLLGHHLAQDNSEKLQSSFNFGPNKSANQTVETVVSTVIKHWKEGSYEVKKDPNAPHEDTFLQLNCDKAHHLIQWTPKWNFEQSLAKTVEWYQGYDQGKDVSALTEEQITSYTHSWFTETKAS